MDGSALETVAQLNLSHRFLRWISEVNVIYIDELHHTDTWNKRNVFRSKKEQ